MSAPYTPNSATLDDTLSKLAPNGSRHTRYYALTTPSKAKPLSKVENGKKPAGQQSSLGWRAERARPFARRVRRIPCCFPASPLHVQFRIAAAPSLAVAAGCQPARRNRRCAASSIRPAAFADGFPAICVPEIRTGLPDSFSHSARRKSARQMRNLSL